MDKKKINKIDEKFALRPSVGRSQPIENYHGSNTVYLVIILMSVVGGVFVLFAMMALCYRSVVVHKNFSLCLRLVYRFIHLANFFVTILFLLFLYIYLSISLFFSIYIYIYIFFSVTFIYNYYILYEYLNFF